LIRDRWTQHGFDLHPESQCYRIGEIEQTFNTDGKDYEAHPEAKEKRQEFRKRTVVFDR
jgi:hypothetical protein